MLGLHARTSTPTAGGQRTPTARPDGGQPGEDERLTSDPPRNGAMHPPRGRPSATPIVSHAVGPVLGSPSPHHPCLGHTGNEPRPPALSDGRPEEGRRLTRDAPHDGWNASGAPRNGARQPPSGGHFVRARGGAGAGSRTPPVPGTHGQRVLAARPQAQAARRGKAPDTRRPSYRRKATPNPRMRGLAARPTSGRLVEGERLTPPRASKRPAEPGEQRSAPARGANVQGPQPTPHHAHGTCNETGRY